MEEPQDQLTKEEKSKTVFDRWALIQTGMEHEEKSKIVFERWALRQAGMELKDILNAIATDQIELRNKFLYVYNISVIAFYDKKRAQEVFEYFQKYFDSKKIFEYLQKHNGISKYAIPPFANLPTRTLRSAFLLMGIDIFYMDLCIVHVDINM